MNPLSPWKYTLRHKRSALLQIALVCLATVGLFVLVGVLDAIPQRANVSYLTRFSRVRPTGDALDPAVVSLIQAHADVASAIPDNGLKLYLPSLLGTDSQLLFGVSPQDAQVLMSSCHVRLQAGRMFEPRSNEIVLSEEVARALGLELGSEIDRTIDDEYYYAVSAPLVLVGILEGTGAEPSVRLGFVSSAYLAGHERYAPRATGLLVFPQPGRKAAMEDWLETTVRSPYTEVETFGQLVEFLKIARIGVYVVFGIVNSVVSVAVAGVVGIINRIALSRRLSEFGLLHALGRTKAQLARRLTFETAAVAGLGCLLGLGTALAVMWGLKNSLFYSLGMDLDLTNPAPFFFVLPIPLIVVALTFLSVRRVFARLDAVAIVERGQLSQEPTARRLPRSSADAPANPLASLTFYLRHRRRGVAIVAATALMLLSVTLPVFLLSAMTDAMRPYIGYLRSISVVSSVRGDLDPGIVQQIQSHPAVARALPAVPLSVQMVIPPSGGTGVRVYGVSETDLPALLDVFGMQVQEGRLPRPRSNEIVLSAAVADNRSLGVGDVIGGTPEDIHELIVDDLPMEMVVVGILSPDQPWIGFASAEYLRSHELTATRSPCLLVVPHAGQKEALDRWLQDDVDGTLARVLIHEVQEREDERMTSSILLTFAALECMVALVAALALAALNHIFFDQRKTEFGVLNAIGRDRRWLVLRTIKETASVVGLGWALGAALCGMSLLAFQALVYGPRGLRMSLYNPTSWLLTLPIPLAVIAASAGTIARMLRRFDPVSVIEQKEQR